MPPAPARGHDSAKNTADHLKPDAKLAEKLRQKLPAPLVHKGEKLEHNTRGDVRGKNPSLPVLEDKIVPQVAYVTDQPGPDKTDQFHQNNRNSGNVNNADIRGDVRGKNPPVPVLEDEIVPQVAYVTGQPGQDKTDQFHQNNRNSGNVNNADEPCLCIEGQKIRLERRQQKRQRENHNQAAMNGRFYDELPSMANRNQNVVNGPLYDDCCPVEGRNQSVVNGPLYDDCCPGLPPMANYNPAVVNARLYDNVQLPPMPIQNQAGVNGRFYDDCCPVELPSRANHNQAGVNGRRYDNVQLPPMASYNQAGRLYDECCPVELPSMANNSEQERARRSQDGNRNQPVVERLYDNFYPVNNVEQGCGCGNQSCNPQMNSYVEHYTVVQRTHRTELPTSYLNK